jgi:hypothetical protein
MPSDSPPIIADAHRRASTRRLFLGVLVAAVVTGAAAAVYYASLDLTLSHYDARAHLVVARRVIDSLTPGWRQIGAVWLPLPHLVQVIPVQVDWFYRTGASAVAMSVIVLAWGLASLAAWLHRRTGSVAAAIAAPAAILANPNVLYLQSTPMTEAMLFGLSLVAVDRADRWIAEGSRRAARQAGLAILLLMLTRYEGWAIGLSLVVASAVAWRAARGSWRGAFALAPWPIGAIGGFLVLSRITVGAWFVASGFFVADNPVRGDAAAVLEQIAEAAAGLSSPALLRVGAIGALVLLWRSRRDPASLILLTLLAAAALPFAAFYQGHPLRVRYMVPLVVAAAALAGPAIAALPHRLLRAAAAASFLGWMLVASPPLDLTADVVREAQWESPFRQGREAVTAALAREWDGTPILASMGSLGHYMQDTSAIGLALHDFLHEGNFYVWDAALESPRRHVNFILIEQRAEGGDVLAERVRDAAAFLDGFSLVAEGGGVSLYRKTSIRSESGSRR